MYVYTDAFDQFGKSRAVTYVTKKARYMDYGDDTLSAMRDFAERVSMASGNVTKQELVHDEFDGEPRVYLFLEYADGQQLYIGVIGGKEQ